MFISRKYKGTWNWWLNSAWISNLYPLTFQIEILYMRTISVFAVVRTPRKSADTMLTAYSYIFSSRCIWIPMIAYHYYGPDDVIQNGQPDHSRCRGTWDVNTLRPTQSGRHFADDIFKCILLNENVWIRIKISLKFVPKRPINNIPALVQIMAWHRPGYKPLSEPMMYSLSTYICVTRPQWVKIG